MSNIGYFMDSMHHILSKFSQKTVYHYKTLFNIDNMSVLFTASLLGIFQFS